MKPVARTLSISLSILAFFAMSLSGCVVNGTSRGVLIVYWQTASGSCASSGISSVRLSFDATNAHNSTQVANIACELGSQSVSLLEGDYTVHVDGLGPGGSVVAKSGAQLVSVLGGTTQQTGTLVLGGSSGATGSVGVAWTVNGDAAMAGCLKNQIDKVVVSVLDDTKATILASAQATCTAGQLTLTGVPPGTRYLQLDGITTQNKSTWGNATLYGPFTAVAGATVVVSKPIDLTLLQPVGGAGVVVSWTLFGQQPAQACAKFGIDSVAVSILNQAQTQTLGGTTVSCAAGSATVTGVPAGAGYVQLDGATAAGQYNYGNATLYGPIQVPASGSLILPAPIDLVDLRSTVSLDWQFADGATCGAHNVSTVYVEVRDGANKIVVPMNDPYAAKPCNLSAADANDVRLIDLQFAKPTCAVPAGAKGLVLCNILGSTLGVTLSTKDASTGAIAYGGSMQIKQIPAGAHTPVATPLLLAPCSSKNPCTTP